MIKIIKGDITTLAVDAIVNAAKIAVREVRAFLAASTSALCATADKECSKIAEKIEVIFCSFSARDTAVYERLLKL